MKKLILMVALLFGANAVVNSQDTRNGKEPFKNLTPEQRAEKRAERMQKTLGLSDDQKKAIYELSLNTSQEKASMKHAGGFDKARFKAMHQRNRERMKAILTADQFSKWQEIKVERMKRIAERKTECNHSGNGIKDNKLQRPEEPKKNKM